MNFSYGSTLDSFIATLDEDIHVRTHPWTTSKRGGGEAYHDFRSHPDLIRESLEDFVPWDRYQGVQRFYDLLAWINGPESHLESNDSAFIGPDPSDTGSGALECTGRLMIFARRLELNLDPEFAAFVSSNLETHLLTIDRDFREGGVSLSYTPSGFKALGSTVEETLGIEFVISFWARGNDEERTMANFDRVVGNLWHALVDLNGVLPGWAEESTQ